MIINANSLHIPLADKSIHCVVTSPPYWGLRDYGTAQWQGGNKNCEHKISTDDGDNKAVFEGRVVRGDRSQCLKCGALRIDRQLGLEAVPDCLGWATGNACGECYVCHTVQWAREVKRVLRDDGTFWLNVGDTYLRNPAKGGSGTRNGRNNRGENYAGMRRAKMGDIQEKNLAGIPWSIAFALRRDGWILRRDIVWKKDTAMPESVNGVRWERHRIKIRSLRSSKQKTAAGIADGRRDHSGDFRLNSSAEYEDCLGCEKCNGNGGYILRRGSWRPTTAHEYIFMFTKKGIYFCNAEAGRNPLAIKNFNGHTNNLPGANMRSVLTFSAESLKEEHYAAYPSSLPEKFIAVGTSEKGCCAACGAPWAPMVEKTNEVAQNHKGSRFDLGKTVARDGGERTQNGDRFVSRVVGWKKTCACATAEVVPCTVLDPFMGSGRTAEAAIRLGRKWVGLDLSLKYCRIATRRLAGAVTKNGSVLYAEHENSQMLLFEN